MALFLATGTGLIAGIAHTFAGPDHLAAIAPLSVDGRQRSWRTGLAWGIGHTGGILVLAIAAHLLKEAVPLEALSVWGERLVGIVLVVLGLWGLHRLFANRIHQHPHEHGDEQHDHVHLHADAARRHDHRHGAFSIGALHGVAGTGHLLGVLPTAVLPGTAHVAAYLVAFGLGSIASMLTFAWLAGTLTARCGTNASRILFGGSCAVAIVVGVLWF